MSFEGSEVEEIPTEVVFEAEIDESSEEPPLEEWSSLLFDLPEENEKRLLFEKGLYYPGRGEICTKYITMSDSAVFRHPYFNYPAVVDPGIKAALLKPELPIIYTDDGQEHYIAICKEMKQCPVRKFHKGLLDEVIDLRYYCVNPNGVRAMGIALRYNKMVKVFNLTDNFLNDDACYHLGEMLSRNSALQELNLTGCRIGPEGARRLFAGLIGNRSLKRLVLSKNQLGDNGMEILAKAVFKGLDVQQIDLSYNNISGKSANELAEALETHNKFTHIDLSWNNLYSPGTYNLLVRLGENTVLQEVNLSWNSLSGGRIGTGIKNLFKAPNLRCLNLSNNKISGEAVTNMIGGFTKAKKLATLDLSYNPLTPSDATEVISKLKTPAVKIQNLVMENVFVNGEFLDILRQVMEMKSRKNAVITYGGVCSGFKPVGPDVREVVLNRVEFLAKRPKKNPVDIALVALQLLKDKNFIMAAKEFSTAIQNSGAPLDQDLIDEIVNVFAGPRTPKEKTVDIKLLVDYIKRKWPDRKLPPTPPPEPEPEPEPLTDPKGKGGKGKEKKKK